MMYVEFIKIFFLADSSELTVLPFQSPKTFDSHFLDMMYVEFIKIFFLADSSELIGVTVISTS